MSDGFGDGEPLVVFRGPDAKGRDARCGACDGVAYPTARVGWDVPHESAACNLCATCMRRVLGGELRAGMDRGEALAVAMDHAEQTEAGRIVVPPGRFLGDWVSRHPEGVRADIATGDDVCIVKSQAVRRGAQLVRWEYTAKIADPISLRTRQLGTYRTLQEATDRCDDAAIEAGWTLCVSAQRKKA